MGIFFALLAATCQGFSYVILKKSFKNFPPSVAYFLDVIFGILIWIPFALILGVNFTQFPLVLLYALVSAILSEAFIFYVLSKGEISITSTIFSTYPIFTVFFSILINHEILLPSHWLFIFLTIIGVLIVSFPKKFTLREVKQKSYIFWPIVGAIAVGISDTLSKNIIDRTSAELFLLGLAVAQLPIGIIYLRLEKQSLSQFSLLFKKFHQYQYAFFGSLIMVISMIFFWLAFSYTKASIASPLTATSPVITIILAAALLKERISRKDLAGLIITIIGVIGISYLY